MAIQPTNGKETRSFKKERRGIEIDMNPMVDLAFLLLTFFMLTTTFSKPQAMELRMPVKPSAEDEQQEQAVRESKALTILLGGEDKVFWYRGLSTPQLNETNYSRKGIRSTLLTLNQQVEDLVVLIKPLEESNFRNLVDILDEMAITEIQRFAVVDASDYDRELLAKTHSP